MSLLNLFKKKETTVPKKVLQASATLYPDFILITTEDKTVVGYSITTTTITKLPVEASAETIGHLVRKHMSLSKTDVPAPTDFKVHYKEFLHTAGFKSAKEHHKGAKFLSIYQKDDVITINPTHNGGATGKDRGFIGVKGMATVQVCSEITDAEFGEQIKAAWNTCTNKSV